MVIFIKVKNTTLNNLIRQTNGKLIIKERELCGFGVSIFFIYNQNFQAMLLLHP